MEYFKRTFENSYQVKGLFQDTAYYLIQEFHNCKAALDRVGKEEKIKIETRIEVIEEVLQKMGFEKYNPFEKWGV